MLARATTEITLLDVYLAIGGEEISAVPTAPPNAECYVG
jgi:DNA-binding IscR family transcriptional regulator